MKKDIYAHYMELALRAAQFAGHITLKYFRKDISIDRKADQSPVTIADREAEEYLRKFFGRECPEHGILGEEYGEERPGAEFRWIIDPIDGTKSFIHGVPLYGVLIGLEHRGEAVLGIIHHPVLEETIYARLGKGCYCNGERVRVADDDPPLLCMSSAVTMHNTAPDAARRLFEQFSLQRTWGDCYGYTLVATGRAQVMIDPIMNLWDLAALKPIIEEAGGVFTDWEGTASIHVRNSIAGTPKWHAEAMKCLKV